MVSDGKTCAPGHEGRDPHPEGTILYKVLWEGFPPEVATWEEEDVIPCGEVDFVAEYEAALEAEDAEDAADDDGESDGEEEEPKPKPQPQPQPQPQPGTPTRATSCTPATSLSSTSTRRPPSLRAPQALSC